MAIYLTLHFLSFFPLFPQTTSQGGPAYADPELAAKARFSHPLGHWTNDAAMRDQHLTAHTVGRIARYKIVEIIYHDDDSQTRIVLVSTQSGRYREIYNFTRDFGPFSYPTQPSRIIHVGSEVILATFDPMSGTGGFCGEGYWWFNAAGPQPVIFEHVNQAIAKRLPKGEDYITDCWAIDFDHSRINVLPGPSWKKAGPLRDDEEGYGSATAYFTVRGGFAEPVKIEIKPLTQ